MSIDKYIKYIAAGLFAIAIVFTFGSVYPARGEDARTQQLSRIAQIVVDSERLVKLELIGQARPDLEARLAEEIVGSAGSLSEIKGREIANRRADIRKNWQGLEAALVSLRAVDPTTAPRQYSIKKLHLLRLSDAFLESLVSLGTSDCSVV